MARITSPDQLQEQWNTFIPSMSHDEITKYLAETSPHHPNPNMAWLYDRLLGELSNV